MAVAEDPCWVVVGNCAGEAGLSPEDSSGGRWEVGGGNGAKLMERDPLVLLHSPE